MVAATDSRMLLPHGFGPKRTEHRVCHDKHVCKALDKCSVHTYLDACTSLPILVVSVDHVCEGVQHSISEAHCLKRSLCCVHQKVDLVWKHTVLIVEFVLAHASFTWCWRFSRKVLVEPALYLAKLDDCAFGSSVFKVWVFHTVACVRQSQAACIDWKPFGCVCKRVKVAVAFRHLGAVDLHVSVREVRAWPAFWAVLPNRNVIVQGHNQVVRDQVFAWHPQVNRVPVLEFLLHQFNVLSTDQQVWRNARQVFWRQEYCVEYFVSHLLRCYAQRTRLAAV